jgi:hypothetical protein
MHHQISCFKLWTSVPVNRKFSSSYMVFWDKSAFKLPYVSVFARRRRCCQAMEGGFKLQCSRRNVRIGFVTYDKWGSTHLEVTIRHLLLYHTELSQEHVSLPLNYVNDNFHSPLTIRRSLHWSQSGTSYYSFITIHPVIGNSQHYCMAMQINKQHQDTRDSPLIKHIF